MMLSTKSISPCSPACLSTWLRRAICRHRYGLRTIAAAEIAPGDRLVNLHTDLADRGR